MRISLLLTAACIHIFCYVSVFEHESIPAAVMESRGFSNVYQEGAEFRLDLQIVQ